MRFLPQQCIFHIHARCITVILRVLTATEHCCLTTTTASHHHGSEDAAASEPVPGNEESHEAKQTQSHDARSHYEESQRREKVSQEAADQGPPSQEGKGHAEALPHKSEYMGEATQSHNDEETHQAQK